MDIKLWINKKKLNKGEIKKWLNGPFKMDEIDYCLRSIGQEDNSKLILESGGNRWDAIIDNNQVINISDPSGIRGHVPIGGRPYRFEVNERITFPRGTSYCCVKFYLPKEETDNADQFLNKLSSVSSQDVDELKVYHYTHLFNALSIIEKGIIASRSALNKGGVNYYDAAGDVIDNNLKAKPYARFYFRTRTQTQFMNEYLGKDVTSDYAKDLCYPKCPFPVIFELPLKQIISSNVACYYSTGNLQSKDTLILSVLSPSRLSTDKMLFKGNIYDIAKNRAKQEKDFSVIFKECERISQQEFLVKDELPISNLGYKILCPSDEIKRLLLPYLNDEIKKKVEVKPEYFYNENRKITVSIDDNSVSLNSNYNIDCNTRYYGTSYFVVRGDHNLVWGSTLLREDNNQHNAFYPSLILSRKDKSFSVYFIDEFARAQKWLVFYQGNRPDVEPSEGLFVKHKEYEAYKSFIENFLESINKVNIDLTKNLFEKWMVNGLHGIAHTARVVFFTHMILGLSNIKDEDLRNACYYAAILHDIGKKKDEEDSQHGEESRNKYKCLIQSQKINQIPEDYEEQVLDAVQYHSVDDRQVPDDKKTLIWKILKDADALDRARLPIRAECKREYLRMDVFKNEESELLLKFATCVTLWTASCAFKDPYKELIERLSLFV